MKTCVASIVFLLAGLAGGYFAGYHRGKDYTTSMAWAASLQSYIQNDAAAASVSVRAVELIDSGQNQEAIQELAVPIGHFYYLYTVGAYTNIGVDMMLRARIEQLASTNQIIAAQIAK